MPHDVGSSDVPTMTHALTISSDNEPELWAMAAKWMRAEQSLFPAASSWRAWRDLLTANPSEYKAATIDGSCTHRFTALVHPLAAERLGGGA